MPTTFASSAVTTVRTRKPYVRLTVEQIEQAKTAWLDGATGPQLAKALNVSEATIYSKVSDKKRHFNRVTEAEMEEMRFMARTGATIRKIAATMDRSESTVIKYVGRKTRTEVRNQIKRGVIYAYTRNHQENLMRARAGMWL